MSDLSIVQFNDTMSRGEYDLGCPSMPANVPNVSQPIKVLNGSSRPLFKEKGSVWCCEKSSNFDKYEFRSIKEQF